MSREVTETQRSVEERRPSIIEDEYGEFVDVEETVRGGTLTNGEATVGRVTGIEERRVENAPDEWLTDVAEQMTRRSDREYITPREWEERQRRPTPIFEEIRRLITDERQPTSVTDRLADTVIVFEITIEHQTYTAVYETTRFNRRGLLPSMETYPDVEQLSDIAERVVPIRGTRGPTVRFDTLRENEIPWYADADGIWNALQTPFMEINRDDDGYESQPLLDKWRDTFVNNCLISMSVAAGLAFALGTVLSAVASVAVSFVFGATLLLLLTHVRYRS